MEKQDFWAAGKLLIFGEYLVLKNVDCWAIPLKYGQSLSVKNGQNNQLTWKSYEENHLWFQMQCTEDFEIIKCTDENIANKTILLLKWIKERKQSLFSQVLDFEIHSNFPFKWGLGSSSTLISLLAQWSQLDPYKMLNDSFGGSGYDIACATAQTPILFNKLNQKVEPIFLSSLITDQLLFVYSGQKQNSQIEVTKFKNQDVDNHIFQEMNEIVNYSIKTKDIQQFEILMEQSENLLSKILKKVPIKSKFPDYKHAIKSLGAWGGDFFMATFENEAEARDYFKQKGYLVQFTYSELIK